MTAPPIRLVVVTLAVAALACDGRLERRPESAGGASRPAAAPSGSTESQAPQADASAGGFSSEAERTRAMEAQAADLKRQYDDAMAGAATEEEKLRAYQEFEQGREELNQMSEGDLGEGEDAYPPPPER